MTYTHRTKPVPAKPSTVVDEVRQGRNFIRKGDPIMVKVAGKTQFRSGYRFIGWDTANDLALVKAPNGNVRSVGLEGIKRKAVTRGRREEAS